MSEIGSIKQGARCRKQEKEARATKQDARCKKQEARSKVVRCKKQEENSNKQGGRSKKQDATNKMQEQEAVHIQSKNQEVPQRDEVTVPTLTVTRISALVFSSPAPDFHPFWNVKLEENTAAAGSTIWTLPQPAARQ